MFARKILFEFEDLKWFPDVIRSGMTDYLRYLLTALQFYKPISPLILEVMSKTDSNTIVDLCSGGGGAIEQVYSDLKAQSEQVQVVLTDKFPNLAAYQFLKEKTKGGISFSEKSVDASAVPSELKGVRTIFSGFHHFDSDFAKSVLKDAVDSRSGICIFDGGNKSIWMILGAIFIHPILFLIFTPFFRPFRLSRILFTYLIPLIPLCTMWDGIVSILRLYNPEELYAMAKSISNNYEWRSGKVKSGFGLNMTFLTGHPKTKI
ncbi:MAG: class I SAM-dependent methyltransferase [Bacteroidota bacterium]